LWGSSRWATWLFAWTAVPLSRVSVLPLQATEAHGPLRPPSYPPNPRLIVCHPNATDKIFFSNVERRGSQGTRGIKCIASFCYSDAGYADAVKSRREVIRRIDAISLSPVFGKSLRSLDR
jgi:hypothetical protein